MNTLTAANLIAFLMADIGLFGKNECFDDEKVSLYARRNNQYLGPPGNLDRYETLVVSRISVHPDFRGLGIYKEILDIFEQCAASRNRAICIEGVGNVDHFAIYERRGFNRINKSSLEGSPDYWFIKLPEAKNEHQAIERRAEV